MKYGMFTDELELAVFISNPDAEISALPSVLSARAVVKRRLDGTPLPPNSTRVILNLLRKDDVGLPKNDDAAMLIVSAAISKIVDTARKL